MPPKAKISRDMILDTAFDIVQREGIDKVTARSISERLHCSTQPVLYYFSTVEDIKKAVYAKVDEFHSNYIMDIKEDCENPMLEIGMNYIRFAREEKNLFCFLFQSNGFSGTDMLGLTESEELAPIFVLLQKELDVSLEDAKDIFATLFIYAHGYASLYANNTMIYDELSVAEGLQKIFYGAICAAKGEEHEKDI